MTVGPSSIGKASLNIRANRDWARCLARQTHFAPAMAASATAIQAAKDSMTTPYVVVGRSLRAIGPCRGCNLGRAIFSVVTDSAVTA